MSDLEILMTCCPLGSTDVINRGGSFGLKTGSFGFKVSGGDGI